ncbi:MAG: hypothetical protein KAR31_06565, partial [Candidatus Omnitrophica bacterium]|nr:hypothetical protein [Candidatus Omnitrophota bacterium]
LRLRNPRASKFTDMNNISVTRIEQATMAVTGIMRNAGIEFDRRTMTVIPTQYADDKLVVLSVPTMAGYKNMRNQHKRNVGKGKGPANSEVYFYNKDGSFSRFETAASLVQMVFGAQEIKVGISEIQEKMFQRDAVIVTPEEKDFAMDHRTSLELFGNKNRYFEHGGAKFNLADISKVMEQSQIDELKSTVEGLDREISNNVFQGRRVRKTAASPGESDMKVFSGITVTRSGKKSARIIHASNQYILEITPDLALSPMKIGPALVNTTAEGMTLQAKSKGFISHALEELKSRGASGVAQRTVEMARNIAEGNPYENIRTISLNGREGREYVEKTFPTQVKISDLSRLVNNMANVEGADEIRIALTTPAPAAPQYALRASSPVHREFAQKLMNTEGIEAASSAITMAVPVDKNIDRGATQEKYPEAPFTAPAGLPRTGEADGYPMKTAGALVTADRTSRQSGVFREMDTGPPVVGSSVQTEIPEVTSLVIPQLQLPAVSSP